MHQVVLSWYYPVTITTVTPLYSHSCTCTHTQIQTCISKSVPPVARETGGQKASGCRSPLPGELGLVESLEGDYCQEREERTCNSVCVSVCVWLHVCYVCFIPITIQKHFTSPPTLCLLLIDTSSTPLNSTVSTLEITDPTVIACCLLTELFGLVVLLMTSCCWQMYHMRVDWYRQVIMVGDLCHPSVSFQPWEHSQAQKHAYVDIAVWAYVCLKPRQLTQSSRTLGVQDKQIHLKVTRGQYYNAYNILLLLYVLSASMKAMCYDFFSKWGRRVTCLDSYQCRYVSVYADDIITVEVLWLYLIL